MIGLLVVILLIETTQLLLLFVTLVFIVGSQATGEGSSRAFQKEGQINFGQNQDEYLNQADVALIGEIAGMAAWSLYPHMLRQK